MRTRAALSASLRLAVVAGGIVLLSSSLLALWSRSMLAGRLVGAAHAHIGTIARGFITAHADAILTGDAPRVERALRGTLAAEESVQWIAIVGTDGAQLAAGPGLLPGPVRESIRTTPTLTDVWTTAIRGPDETSYDIAMPVVPSLKATVHVGVSERWLERPLVEADLVMGAATTLITLLAAVLAWAFGRRLGKPTERLVAAAHRIGAGDPNADIPERTGDPHLNLIARAMEQMRRDIEAHRVAETRAAGRAATAEKMAALGTLVAGIAHQVNNPLAGVQSCLEMVRGADDSGERQEYLELAQEAVTRLAEVMTRLTQYARTGLAGPRPTSLNEVVREALAFCRVWDRETDPAPVVALDPAVPGIDGEPDALSDVIVNLYSNARLAAPGEPIHVTTGVEAGSIVVMVRDHGPGVPAESRLRIFEPYYSTREAGRGTGLGLALSDAVVRRHGGSITVGDAPGGGALFTVRLPSTPSEPEVRS